MLDASYCHNIFVFTGLLFNKGIGQHILKNPLVITSMVDKVSFFIDFL